MEEPTGSCGVSRNEREVGKELAARTAAVGEEEGQTQVEDEAGPLRRRLGEGHRASAAVGRRSGSQRDNYPGASRRSVPGQIRQILAEDSAAADEGLQGATWTRQGGVL